MPLTLVVGPGRAGSALALAERRAGREVLLVGRTSGAWQSWARRQGIATATRASTTPAEAARVLLAVPDDALAATAAALAAEAAPAQRARLAAHVSGLHGLEELAPFAACGFRIAALHPLLAFGDPEQSCRDLEGATVTVLAGEGAQRSARAAVRDWGARPMDFPAGADRRLYHLALSLAANHVTAAVGWAEELLVELLGGEGRELACDLAAQAVARVRAAGAAQALTGPVVRGDADAVRAHLRALPARDRARYASALVNVIALARRSGRLPAAAARRLKGLTEATGDRP